MSALVYKVRRGHTRVRALERSQAKRILRDEPSSFVFLGSRCAARGAEAIERIVAAVPEAAGRLSCVELDVTSDASVVAALDAVRAACPGDDTPLYGLVINARRQRDQPRVFDLQNSTFVCLRVCRRRKRRGSSGAM